MKDYLYPEERLRLHHERLVEQMKLDRKFVLQSVERIMKRQTKHGGRFEVTIKEVKTNDR